MNTTGRAIAGPPLPRESSWVALLGLVAAGFGIFLLLISGIDLCNTSMARGWSATPGTVLVSRVWYDPTWHQTGMHRSEAIVSWQSYMKYQYQVGGKNYESERISVEGFNNRRVVIAREHPAGSSVTVFYDPGNPAAAAVDRNTSLWTYVWFLSGLMIDSSYVVWRVRVMKRLRARG